MSDWLQNAISATCVRLTEAPPGPDRCALLRTLVFLKDGYADISQIPGLTLTGEDTAVFPRFGLVQSGESGLRIQAPALPKSLAALEGAFRLDPDLRRKVPSELPDTFLLRNSVYEQYSSPTQKAAARGLLTMPPGAGMLVEMPTGMGKSLLFQLIPFLPAPIGRKPCAVVIVPTVALALDHELTLQATPGLEGARAITGDLSQDEVTEILGGFRRGEVPVLILSPEKAMRPEIMAELVEAARPVTTYSHLRGLLTHIVVDEAHIVESWGRSFRPDFQRLPALLNQVRGANPDLRCLLLSATLTLGAREVLRSGWGQSGDWLEISSGTPRSEHDLYVCPYKYKSSRDRDLRQIIDLVPRPAIVYFTEVEEANEIFRQSRGAAGYERIAIFTGETGGAERRQILKDWKENRLDLIVATSAFGMGVDKADVRTVIHACLPENASRWYQEVGRAARDGGQGFGILMYTTEGRDADTGMARGLAGTGLLTREIAEERWGLLLREHTVVDGKRNPPSWRVPIRLSRKLIPPKHALRAGATDYNQTWNASLLLLLQRSGVIEILSCDTGEGEKPDDYWTLAVRDPAFLEQDAAPVWDQVYARRQQEIEAARGEQRAFEALLKSAEDQCLIRSVFGLIDPGAWAPRCGRCNYCRRAKVAPPGVLAPGGMAAVWPQAGRPSAALGPGVFLMNIRGADIEETAAAWLRTLSAAGLEQFIAPRHVLARLSPRQIRDLEGAGLMLAFETWEAEGAPAPVSSAVILGEDTVAAAGRINALLAWCRQHSGLTVVVLADPGLEVGGRRLDQFVSPNAPLSPEIFANIVAVKGIS